MKSTNTWRSLHQKLSNMTEEEVYAALQDELAQDKRVSILERLHQRYCTLRMTRERLEILNEARKV